VSMARGRGGQCPRRSTRWSRGAAAEVPALRRRDRRGGRPRAVPGGPPARAAARDRLPRPRRPLPTLWAPRAGPGHAPDFDGHRGGGFPGGAARAGVGGVAAHGPGVPFARDARLPRSITESPPTTARLCQQSRTGFVLSALHRSRHAVARVLARPSGLTRTRCHYISCTSPPEVRVTPAFHGVRRRAPLAVRLKGRTGNSPSSGLSPDQFTASSEAARRTPKGPISPGLLSSNPVLAVTRTPWPDVGRWSPTSVCARRHARRRFLPKEGQVDRIGKHLGASIRGM
jgi:hypothetical protein